MLKKVLIVDDEPNIRLSLQFLLKKEGYVTETAENGVQAVEKYESFQPEIVLLDVMMPEMDGFEAAKRIRRQETERTSHIIFLTAKGTPEDEMNGYKSGAEHYLVKPFDNKSLLEKMVDLPV